MSSKKRNKHNHRRTDAAQLRFACTAVDMLRCAEQAEFLVERLVYIRVAQMLNDAGDAMQGAKGLTPARPIAPRSPEYLAFVAEVKRQSEAHIEKFARKYASQRRTHPDAFERKIIRPATKAWKQMLEK